MTAPNKPLAERMRPRALAQFVGQSHLLGSNKPLSAAIAEKQLHSMILWGPPGVGKTTLALLLADHVDAIFESLSAVLCGVKEIRAIIERAKMSIMNGRQTIVFVDEVHRFNKAQQDVFLPHVEAGTFILVGATTENPGFQVNQALLSRLRVYVLNPLAISDIVALLSHAHGAPEGLGAQPFDCPESVLYAIARVSGGDARAALNRLEQIASYVHAGGDAALAVEAVLTQDPLRFDHGGDVFYDQLSALHKSIRGSAPDAALYWMARMLDSGCDPHVIARRVLCAASEDIGNADPRAVQLALAAWQAYERLGLPEGELALAQAVTYCASAPKSNAVYLALKAAKKAVKQQGDLPVPTHLRQATSSVTESLGFSKGYRYPHDEANAYAPGVNYMPDNFRKTSFYQPVSRGLEIKIKEKLDRLDALSAGATLKEKDCAS